MMLFSLILVTPFWNAVTPEGRAVPFYGGCSALVAVPGSPTFTFQIMSLSGTAYTMGRPSGKTKVVKYAYAAEWGGSVPITALTLHPDTGKLKR